MSITLDTKPAGMIVTSWTINDEATGEYLDTAEGDTAEDAIASYRAEMAEDARTGVIATPRRKVFRWIVAIEVSEIWVADGFELTTDRLEHMLGKTLSYARSNEYAGEILGAPSQADIRRTQGYTDAEVSAEESKVQP